MKADSRVTALERKAPGVSEPQRIQVWYARTYDESDPGVLAFEMIVYPDGTREVIECSDQTPRAPVIAINWPDE